MPLTVDLNRMKRNIAKSLKAQNKKARLQASTKLPMEQQNLPFRKSDIPPKGK